MAKGLSGDASIHSARYYELGHAYAHLMLVNKNFLTKTYPFLRTIYCTWKSLRFNPKNDRALYLAGAIALVLKQRKRAKGFFNQALLTNPNNLNAYKSLATLLYEERAFGQATALIQKALKVNARSQPSRRRQIELAALYMKMDESVVIRVKKHETV